MHDYKPVERIVAPFTEEQIQQLKRTAQKTPRSTRRPAALALILCGASLPEAANSTVGDVDILGQRHGFRAVLTGTRSAKPTPARTTVPPHWAARSRTT